MRRCGLISVALAMMMVPARAARGADAIEQYVKQATAPYRARVSEIAAQHKDDPAMRQFLERLALIDRVSGDIIRSFEDFRSGSLNALLDKAVSRRLTGSTRPATRPATAASQTGAADLLARYADRFAEPLPAPAVSSDDRRILISYYSATIDAVGRYIAQRGQVAAAGTTTGANPDALGLSLVLPFLSVPDEQWSPDSAAEIPAWLKQPSNRAALEQFALHVRRPITAYHLSRLNATQPSTRPALEQQDYLQSAAAALTRQKDYPAAVAALTVARKNADAAARPADAARFRIDLATLYYDTGQSFLGVSELQPLLGETDPDVFGKVALLHVKCLWAAKRYSDVLTAASRWKQDPRAQKCAAPLIYIGWVASRQVPGVSPSAAAWREEFMQKFPDHLLAADMYFASAMEELADGRYDEAQRILEYIEFRYPAAAIALRAKEIRERLTQRPAQASSTTTPAQ